VFVRAQLSRALDGDVEAWNERGQAQPVEDAEPGSVVEVLQKGYTLGDRVLRPARVVVAE